MYTCRYILGILIEVWRLRSRRVSPIAHRDSNIEKPPGMSWLEWYTLTQTHITERVLMIFELLSVMPGPDFLYIM